MGGGGGNCPPAPMFLVCDYHCNNNMIYLVYFLLFRIYVVSVVSDVCSEMIADLTNSIIRDNTMPSEWKNSIIISLYKGKGEALDRGNYQGLNLTEHILKIMEHIIEDFIQNIVNIDNMQFGFMPGHGTTDTIFILRQIQEAYIRKNGNLFFAFVDLEKAFDRVPRKVLWWALRKVGILNGLSVRYR